MRLRPRDLADEVISGVVQRPGRSVLTAVGTALALAAFVAVLGLTATTQGQVSARFTELSATEVVLERSAVDPDEPAAFPRDAQDRVAALPGVRAVGVSWPVPIGQSKVGVRPEEVDGEALSVLAASPGYFQSVHARVGQGVAFDAFHDGRAEDVAVVGRAAATRLGLTRLDAQPAIFVQGRAFTVIGVVDAVDRRQDTLLSVLVPAATATKHWGPSPASGGITSMLVDTELGAAQQVGRQAKAAARPESPEKTKVIVPPDPRALRDAVSTDLNGLFLGLAGVSLVVGGVGIANTSLVAVLERVPEIGLRRALGARRRHIAGQFLLESATLGLLGGLVGTAVGVVTVLLVSIARELTPILEPQVVYPAPVLGVITGLLAGLYPAWRATRIEPAEALRR
ncbi:ABC transporter permease [Actinokineospora globicatena]|uniref:ABC transporter permease n=1 Tax=Actinokineospora globicatena TaxID=103729 RepID=UPI0020A48D37|nr:FtsX-like permease family protein [Actinokineospora globicatena]MCP2302910.1 putative ABC transport system permease protein [Actinokineospora globicatena]GLW78705.1 ABC transporter permease [Actinokineospora globicatena]GLW84627.1 ABC transporter permease [Actinokineospora globicatena]